MTAALDPRTNKPPTRTVLRPFAIIRDNRRPYVILNLAMFGLLIAGFVAGLVFPELNAAQVSELDQDGTTDKILSLLGNVWIFALAILFNNAVQVGAVIAVPSLVVPFAGIAYFGYKATAIGITLAANGADLWGVMAPHLLTVVIEIEAYVILTLGAYILGRSWIFPRTIGATTRRRGYVRGLQQLGWLTLPALVLLIIGALYEAFTMVYVMLPQIAENAR